MLHIAVVGNSYQEVMRFVEYKFKGHIKEHNKSNATYTLTNGDVIQLCYDEAGRDKYRSFLYDAIIITDRYESLLDVIRGRTVRPLA